MPKLLPGAVKSSTATEESWESGHRRRLSWCLRDAAQDLVEERQALLLDSTSSTAAATTTTTTPSQQQTAGPLFSRHFDTAVGVDRLTQDKHILPAIFDLAASTVLQAIRKQQEESLPSSSSSDDTISSSQLEIDDEDSSLPKELLEYRRLQQVRVQCLERSHENKEYCKRKGAKIDPEVQAAAAHRQQAAKKTAPVAKPVASAKAAPASLKKKKESTTTKSTTTTAKKTSSTTTATKTKAKATPSTQESAGGPKFSRNTPASSAAALDFRFTSSRAILCAAGNLAFAATTPGPELDVVDVPQNPSSPAGKKAAEEEKDATDTSNTTSNNTPVNMGEVVIEAQTLGRRTISSVENVVRRAALRYQYRMDNARYNQKEETRGLLHVPNPFDWKIRSLAKDQEEDESSSNSTSILEDAVIPYNPRPDACTEFWRSHSLPRFLSVLEKGAGHAVYFDLRWSSRHGRIADLLKSLSNKKNNFGPHLIVTTEPEVVRFGQEFHDLNKCLGLITTNESKWLQVLVYQGTKMQRRALRQYFSQAAGLPESPFHILVTSYTAFFEDYLHFCQLPFDSVVLDEGLGWLAAAYGDQNSSLRSIWETAIFSTNDQHIGLAGTSFKEWDFSRETFPESVMKDAWVGLATRHRIVTASTFMTHQRTGLEPVSVSCLVGFLAPHFTDVVREEWDRSRIFSDTRSMKHFRGLVARSTIVHAPTVAGNGMDAIVVDALLGRLGAADREVEPQVPRVIPDEEFVSSGKVASSRRWTLSWLGAPETSWMRYELGKANFLTILDVMKLSDNHGYFCEEITTASSTTTSGASGQVAGSMAYRLAVRCGRHFGSEQGLRQHISAMHAPPGTWLCRTCSTDCITSQARTHHERTCGQLLAGRADDALGTGGASPIVGQGGGPKSGVGKKKSRTTGSQKGAAAVEEKDADGSFRVPGYRGVWINKAGKHFVKINGKRHCEPEGSDDVLFFDGADNAGKKYDELSRKNNTKNQKLELNFKPDGSRIVYEDITPASTSGLGGSAASVVPALSVINIKDLPPEVKPLLRDPRMTSRTGGNSKRHVYAYRGVCRQARKGHDRWQSQISFMGQNHYLGTFDSEWDAAAIYAWAHLILYGEEATRQAQKEGEEAAAAYEQEKRDIAAGKIPAPPPKPEKKKRAAPPKKKEKEPKHDKAAADEEEGTKAKAPKKRKRKADGPAGGGEKKPRLSSEKKGKASSTAAAKQKESITPVLAKGVAKAPALSQRDAFKSVSDDELVKVAAAKMKAARQNGYVGSVLSAVSPAVEWVRPCIQQGGEPLFLGIATLLGISPASSGWDLQAFVEDNPLGSDSDAMMALQMLAVEYDEGGVNESFTSIIQGTVCIIGCASKKTQRAAQVLGLDVPTGGSIGKLDCHIGGVPGSCSEASACIRYAPTAHSEFQIACLAADDIVTLNGRRLKREEGCVPLRNGDICSVGARVFSFIVAVES